jgi:hypothetical protein
MSPAWVTRARCSTSKPKSLTDSGFPSCAKSWRKQGAAKGRPRRAGGRGDRRTAAGTLARRGTGGRNRRAASASERVPPHAAYFGVLSESAPETGTRWRERAEFELPVPVCEQSDDGIRLGFATSRRTANLYRPAAHFLRALGSSRGATAREPRIGVQPLDRRPHRCVKGQRRGRRFDLSASRCSL